MIDFAVGKNVGRDSPLRTSFEDRIQDREVFDSESAVGESFLDKATFDTVEVESLFQTFENPKLKLGETDVLLADDTFFCFSI
jgi:hypothetical protein